MMKGRVSFVKELWETCSFFFAAPERYDEKTVKKRWKEDSAQHMTELAEVLAGIDDFSIEGQEKVVMDWIATDRKSTRLNSSHANTSYAVFCLKKKKDTVSRLL